MNAKISVFVNCVEAIIYFLIYNLHDCPFKYYIQPKPEENQPDTVLLHVGTNDLSSAKNANEIASEVMELVDICRRLKLDVIVSEIVSRGDELNLKNKAVNNYLKEMFQ